MNISKCKCGGNAIIRQDHFGVSYGDWKIFCEKCGMQTGWIKNKEDAIELWNRVMGETDINVGNKFDKDINVPSKERMAKVTQIETNSATVFLWKCNNCGQPMHKTSCGRTVNYCASCGAKLDWSEDE